MKTIFKKICLCTSILMICSIFSCNKIKSVTESSSSDTQGSSLSYADNTNNKEKPSPIITSYYDARLIKGVQDFSYISEIKYSGGKLYILGKEYSESSPSVFSTNLDTSETAKTEKDESIPEGFDDCNSYKDFKGNIYCCSDYSVKKYDLKSKSIDYIDREFLYKYNDLKLLKSICSTTVSKSGDIYVAASIRNSDSIYIIKLNNSLQIQYISENKDLSVDNDSIIKFFTDENGNPVLCTESDCTYINEISADTGSTVLKYEFPAAQEIIGAYKNYNVIYRNGNSIYGYDHSKDNTTELYKADISTSEITRSYLRDNSVITEQLEIVTDQNLLGIYNKDGQEEKKVIIPDEIVIDDITITPDGTVLILANHSELDYTKENKAEEENNSDKNYAAPCSDGDGVFINFQPMILGLEEDGSFGTIFKGKQEHDIAVNYCFSTDSKGNVCICYSSNGNNPGVHATLLSVTGEQTYMTYGVSGNVRDVVCINDEFIIEVDSYKNNDSSLLLLPVDKQNHTINDPLDTQLPSDDLIEGSNGYDFYYQSGNVIYGFDIADGSSEKILSWFDSDIRFIPDSKLHVAIADSENIFCVDNGIDYETYSDSKPERNYISAMHLKKADEAILKELNSRNIITLAGINIDNNYFSKIQKFNKTYKDYLIVATDYSQYNISMYDDSPGDPTGLNKLRTDISQGNIPDIILRDDSFDINILLKNDILADLNDMLRNDPDIDMSDLAENILDTCKYNGKLYAVPYMFSLTTLTVPEKCIKNKDMLTYNEFFSLADRFGDSMRIGCTRDQISNLLFSSYINDNFDFEKSKCNFETDIFKSILEKTKEYIPENIKYNVNNGSQTTPEYLFNLNSISKLYSFYYYLTDTDYKHVLNSLKGIPSLSDTAALINIDTYLCITDSSENKEGAWKFIKFFIDDKEDEYINKSDLMSIFCSENKKSIYSSVSYMTDEQFTNSSQSDTEKFNTDLKTLCYGKFINNSNFSEILKITCEQADMFYNDKLSTNETISAIQSKTELYLSEIN